MSKTKIEVRRVADLQVTFYVRKELDQDNVMRLALVYEAEQQKDNVRPEDRIPPLEITPDGQIIKGRHRKAALELLGQDEVECVVVDITDPTELLARALADNMKGSVQARKEDIIFTMEQLLGQSAGLHRIVELFDGVLLPSVARKYVRDAQSNIAKRNLELARQAVAIGTFAVPAAAKHFRVKEKTLRDAVAGVRQSKKAIALDTVKSGLSITSKSFATSFSAQLRNLANQYEDGVASVEITRQGFEHAEKLLQGNLKSLREKRSRFEKVAEKRDEGLPKQEKGATEE